jgi:DNA-binding NarL/FixJ family response regulator
MKWHPPVANDPTTIFVASSNVLIRALLAAAPASISALQVESGDSILDVLDVMAREAAGVPLLCVSDDLVFREARSGLGAVAFCQHVRLTPALGPLRWRPIVVAVQGNPDQALRANVERLFYFAPGCYATSVTQVVARLLSGGLPSPVFADEDDLRRAIRPFLLETEAARSTAAHDYRNLAGAGKLLHEFGGDVLEPTEEALSTYRRLAATDLLLKARCFLSGGGADSGVDSGPAPLSDLRRDAGAHRVVFVDDEHRKGWSLALFSGLFGTRPAKIEKHAPGVELKDDRLWCIDSPSAAEAFFKEWSGRLNETLSVWAVEQFEARQDRTTALDGSARHAAVAKRVADAESEAARAEARVTAAADALSKSVAGLQSIASPELEALLDCYTNSTGEVLEALLARKGSIAQLSSALDDYQRKIAAAEQAASDREKAQADLARIRVDAASSEKRIADATEKAKRSEARLRATQESLNGLALGSVVMLDMRLDPDGDRDRAPGETSGARVLAGIKALFPFLPVVMLTASARAESIAALRALGADGYWIKYEGGGQELAQVLRLAFRKSAVHTIWMDLERVAVKRVLRVKSLDETGRFQPVQWTQGHRDRDITLQFLRRVCELLAEAASEPAIGRPATASLMRQTMVDLGFIQEMRYANNTKGANNTKVADKVWGQLLPSEEQKLRTRRNGVIHHGETVTLAEGVGFLKYTVRQLLAE